MPPIAGTLWQAAQLVALNAGPRPSSIVSTEVNTETKANAFEFTRTDAAEGITGLNGVELADQRHDQEGEPAGDDQRDERTGHQFSTMRTPCMKS